MRYCNKPFSYLNMRSGGDVGPCAWIQTNCGNLLEEELETIWNGEKFEKIRDSILDGSFRYCSKEECPVLSNGTLMEADVSDIKTLPFPEEFNVAFDHTCNHACPSCRKEVFLPDKKYTEDLQTLCRNILPYLNRARKININGDGELFASNTLLGLMKRLSPEYEEIEINLEINGSLCNEKNWKKIQHLERYNLNVIVTPNSFIKDAYEYLCGGMKHYEDTMDNLRFLGEKRMRGEINKMVITMVVQDRNFREIPEFIHKSLEVFHADSVTLRYIHYWYCLTEEEWWFKNVANPLHPYFKEYKNVMESDPIIQDDRVFQWNKEYVMNSVEHPANKFKYDCEILEKLLLTAGYGEKLFKLLQKKGITSVIIYGAGRIGAVLAEILKSYPIQVVYFIDKYRTGDINGYSIKKIDALLEKSENYPILVTAHYYFNNIKKELELYGYSEGVWDLYNLVMEI